MTIAVVSAQSTLGGSTTNGTVFTTASITPPLGSLVLIAVVGSATTVGTAESEASPTITGACISNLQGTTHVSWDVIATPNERMVVYAAQGTGSAGAITITWGASQTSCVWNIGVYTGVDTTVGTGGAAQVQTNNSDTLQTGAAFTTTLPNPLSIATNAMVGFPAQQSQNGINTVATGYTELGGGRANTTANALCLDQQYNLTPSGLSFTTTWSGAARCACMLVELSDTVPPPPAPSPIISPTAMFRASNW
jgi:hypothetical protein